MKKIALLFVLAAFAATPAAAAPKNKSTATPKTTSEMSFDDAMAYNRKNLSLIVQGLPLVLPSWSLPFYFGLQKDADKTKYDNKKYSKKKY